MMLENLGLLVYLFGVSQLYLELLELTIETSANPR
ncbi:hypothetical protein Lepto7375DRAFT_4540 [Leptolyngbya sp. PCC 7375]|nr:hypothetical protein Lepto7375DRAFT_4540 [Leptolyngbya sp. PCC 7375]